MELHADQKYEKWVFGSRVHFDYSRMGQRMRTARVFISCGQRSDEEKKVGLEIEKHFTDRGFETYFAEKVHSPDALTANIFRFLSESEFFVWIDFKRDRLKNEDYRGSLFVNQELAIATFLALPGLGFTEKGVRREGIADYQIFNAVSFEDSSEIVSIIERETEKWDKDSVNELTIGYDPSATSRGITIINKEGQPKGDFYKLEILNRNKRRHAFSCLGYITGITDLVLDKAFSIPTTELYWSGIADVAANIIAGATRDLDAFVVVYGHQLVSFHQRQLGTTSPKYHLPDLPPGQYRIEYTIISANFQSVAAQFDLEFDGTPDSVRLERVSNE